MSFVPGSRLGAYEIRGSLGAGGMGEVYRAHDPRLARDVALKVLPADLAADPARLERFTREARAIAALNHPHIVTIYSTEEADGVRFLTMELVEGQALDALIPSGGLPLARFFDVALPLADALTAAHQKQITHRDLKPANVMVAGDGRVKVLDFGLASAPAKAGAHIDDVGPGFSPADLVTSPQITTPGMLIGTMPYMSPEQVDGRQLDHRTDLFSLGVMFHEMLVGTRPFTGASSPQLMSSILRDTPSSASDLRPDVPDALSRLISRCLEKNADDRVQTARDIYNELRHVQKQLESGSARRATGGGGPAAVADSLWIAVLPFATRGNDPDGEMLASGLTEDITAGLTRFPSLFVVAPQSARGFKDSPLDVRQIAERLGARFVMGGSVRRSSSRTRVTAHLTDARTGAQLWTETYDSEETDIYAIQDEVTDRLVSTIADKTTGVLSRSLIQSTREVPLDRLTARQFVYRCWGYEVRPTQHEHAELRGAVEAYFARNADDPELRAELGNLYLGEHSLLFNALPDSLGRAFRAARRAIELDPSNQRGWVVLALCYFAGRDEAGLAEAADRVTKLNPRNSNAVAWMGNVLTHIGELDRGCQITKRAMALNTSHAGWYHFSAFNRHFARGEFNEALTAARRVNMADFMWMHLAIAASAGHLGLAAEGRAAIESMVAIAPSLADEANQRELVTRWYWKEEMVESLLEGVRLSTDTAGPPETEPIPSRPRSSPSAAVPARRPSSAAAVTAGTWIAVIPFMSAAHDDDSCSLADGLTDDVTAGLARFPYLSVVAAHSARQHKGSTADVRQMGKALGARYILDGVIRRAGSTMRIAARLVDATSGAQLWSETYSRDAQPSSGLAVQDEVTDRVVATVADVHGVLLRSASAEVNTRPLEGLSAEELILRYWTYHRQHAPAEHRLLRDHLERFAAARAASATFQAMLAHLYVHEYGFGFNPQPDPLARARQAVDAALQLDALNQHAWEALAFIDFFMQDRDAFGHAVDRVLALNPRNANATALVGILCVHAGELDRGSTLVDRAMALNPDHPGWYYIGRGSRHYVLGDFEAALRTAKRINMPQHLWAHALVAMSAAQLGRAEDAAAALDALLALEPSFADPETMLAAARRWKWQEADAQRMLDGYTKAVALRDARNGALSRSSDGTPPRVYTPGSSPSVGRQSTALEIGVASFSARAGDDAAASLAAGLTEDVTTGLSRFAYLRVSRHGVTAANAPRATRYRLEGSVRTAGQAVRISARLVDAGSGANLWAEHFDHDLAGGPFAVQDAVSGKIASRVADPSGVLVRSMVASLKEHPDASMSVYTLTLQYFAHLETLTPEQHARLRDGLEGALKLEPNDATGWAVLADLYAQEQALGHNARPQAVERQRRAAERAIAIDATCQYGWVNLASSHYLSGDIAAFQHEGERAIALNPLNTHVLTYVGTGMALSGSWDRGAALVRQALELNPNLPGHVHLVPFFDTYRRGEDEAALLESKKISMPGLHNGHFARAAASGQLQRRDEAQTALDDLRRVKPEMTDPASARTMLSAWLHDEALVDRLVEGLEKALALTGTRPDPSGQSSGRSPDSAAGLNNDAFVVTVLQFSSGSASGDAPELADGLSQGITVGLSRFNHLRVVARQASMDSVTTGYVLHGSVRSASGVVRVVVQLTEAATRQSLWAETYDRQAASGSIFELQDELTEKIVATVADANGALVRSMSAFVRSKSSETLTPYEAVLRRLAYVNLNSPEEHAVLRDALEQAVRMAPAYADAWASLAYVYVEEHAQSFNVRPDSLERARAAARRALEIDSSNQVAHLALALIAFFSRDRDAFRAAADRAIALNPYDSWTLSFLGAVTAFSGDWDAGLALGARARALNPHHSGMYWFPPVIDHYRRHDYPGALAVLERVNMPGYPHAVMTRAAIYAQLGRVEEGFEVWRDAEARMPGLAARFDDVLRMWFTPDVAEHLREGIGKARAGSKTQPSATGAPTSASIAVLPFADLSAQKDQGWFCDGIAEEILNALTQLPGLRVAARTSAFSFRDRDDAVRAMADKLGVGSVLQGSVRRADDRVRITVQLVDAGNGFQLWSDRYDRELKDIFDIQEDIAHAVADRLKIALNTGERQRIVAPHTPDVPAYERFLRARALLIRRGPSMQAALEQLREVVELFPDFAPAWSAIAEAYSVGAYSGLIRGADARRHGLAAARRAMALAPESADVYAAIGGLRFLCENDRSGALDAHRRALELNPFHVQNRCWYALFLQRAYGRFDEGVAEARRVLEIDPLSAYVTMVLGTTLLTAGRAEDGAALGRRAVEIDPESFHVRWALGVALTYSGQLEEAGGVLEHAAEMSGRHHFAVTSLAINHARRGRRDLALQLHRELLDRAVSGYVPSTQLILTADAMGDRDEAIRHAERALADREPPLVMLARHFPDFQDLRQDPRFVAILRQLDKPWPASAAP